MVWENHECKCINWLFGYIMNFIANTETLPSTNRTRSSALAANFPRLYLANHLGHMYLFAGVTLHDSTATISRFMDLHNLAWPINWHSNCQ